MRKFLFSLFLVGSLLSAAAQDLLPAPQHCEMREGSFNMQRPLSLRYASRTLKKMVCSAGLDTLFSSTGPSAPSTVVLFESLPAGSPPEAYRLDIRRDTLSIFATTADGFRHASTTLRQLRHNGYNLPCLYIDDAPAMEWRGAMIDVSRHFFSVDFLKRQIDVMSRFKLNRLHLHLTDAAGWRMEIKRYPLLTRQAAWRTDSLWKTWWNTTRHYAEEGTPGAYGGYYTQRQLRELVRYAAERGITIVPEIEMPAHSEEVLTAYPELSCTHEPYRQADFCPGNERTFVFLENVLKEVMDVFPSRDIHIGGDEAGKASWGTCPLCRKRMQEEGINHTDALQDYLIRRIGRFLVRHGRRLTGWDEVICHDLPTGSTIMVWRDTLHARRAISLGYDVVLSPGRFCYLDGYQDDPPSQPEAMGGYTPFSRTAGYHPLNGFSEEERRHVRGIQGNLWTEYVPTEQQAEYMLYPRLLAIAETGWRGAPAADSANLRQRVEKATRQLRAEGINAFPLDNERGDRAEARTPIVHLARGAKVSYSLPYHPQYAADGPTSLTDGRRGGWDYGKGTAWQGFIRSRRFDVTLTLDSIRTIHSISANFLQNSGPEIFLPATFVIETSADGVVFEEIYRRNQPVERIVNPSVEQWGWAGCVTARYLRLRAAPGHFGGWIFVDEIEVR